MTALAAACTTAVGEAQDSVRTAIRGTVRDSLGFPAAGASVMLTPGTRMTRVDTAGQFILRDVAPGSSMLRVRRLGFASKDTVIYLGTGASIDLALVMQRLPQRLDTVRVAESRQCARFTIEGVLCRRGTAAGLFLNQEDIKAKKPTYVGDVLGGEPGFRLTNVRSRFMRTMMVRDVVSTVGWRCIKRLVNGQPMSVSNPEPRVKDLFAVEVYQPDEAPPEYQSWVWQGSYPCTLVVYWTVNARQR